MLNVVRGIMRRDKNAQRAHEVEKTQEERLDDLVTSAKEIRAEARQLRQETNGPRLSEGSEHSVGPNGRERQ